MGCSPRRLYTQQMGMRRTYCAAHWRQLTPDWLQNVFFEVVPHMLLPSVKFLIVMREACCAAERVQRRQWSCMLDLSKRNSISLFMVQLQIDGKIDFGHIFVRADLPLEGGLKTVNVITV